MEEEKNVESPISNMNEEVTILNKPIHEKIKVHEEIKEEKRSLNKKKTNNTTVILVVSILLSFICGMLGAYLMISTKELNVQSVVKNITTSELVETSISTSVDKVYGSTAVIIASAKGKKVSTGTGFVYKKDDKIAYIMTNNHVVENADAVQIEFSDKNEKIDAKIVGKDKYSDIAVLSIPVNKAEFIVEIGDSTSVSLGDTVFTVGAPMGIDYKGTVTKGIISGKDRMVAVNLSGSTNDYYMKVLQIDAAVNPGNSGGPLCDVSGKVLGIISLKIVQDSVEGMGFAIPIEDALKYANQIESGESIVRPFIGISMLDLTNDYYLYQYRIDIPKDLEKGIAIIDIVEGAAADKAGLKKGDIIIKLDDTEVGSLAEFRYALYKHSVGDKVKVTYYRDDKQHTTTITLGKEE